MIPQECIIVGGGASIKSQIEALKTLLSHKFTILTNYAFLHFDGTLLTCIDQEFYKPSPQPDGKEINPDYYNELSKLPLIISTDSNNLPKIKHPNTLLLKPNAEYQREKCSVKGFYTGNLTGIFSLTVASYLMNYAGTIFLLGFDWDKRDKKTVDPKAYSSYSTIQTHYYDDIKHRGTGYVGYYENHDPQYFFKYFKEPKLKIYNVSLQSNIETFEKISYEKMFDLLSQETINQNELREEIKSKL